MNARPSLSSPAAACLAVVGLEMSYRLGCELAPRVAAIAPVAGNRGTLIADFFAAHARRAAGSS